MTAEAAPLELEDEFTIEDDHLDYRAALEVSTHHLWTVVEGDDGLYACPGFRVVNRQHYLVTEEPWQESQRDTDYLYAGFSEEGT